MPKQSVPASAGLTHPSGNVMKGECRLKSHRNEYHSLILTFILLIVSILLFFGLNGRTFPNMSLWVPISLYSLVGVGYVISLLIALRLKNTVIKTFSLLATLMLLLPLVIWVYLLLLANGISEP
ncbi:hypothetical protein [Exiguobacterium sp. ERU656]